MKAYQFAYFAFMSLAGILAAFGLGISLKTGGGDVLWALSAMCAILAVLFGRRVMTR